MAHASGNPTWQDYPSTSTLVTATSLENVENLVDAHHSKLNGLVGSSGYSSPPVCVVGLSSNFTVGTTNLYGQTGWSTSSTYGGYDGFSMAYISSSSGTYSYIAVPIAGRYRCQFHGAMGSTTAGLLLCRLTVNQAGATTPTGSIALGQATPFGSNNTELGVDAVSEHYVFAAGDKIYWSNYANVGSGTATVYAAINGLRTFISVRYVGPN